MKYCQSLLVIALATTLFASCANEVPSGEVPLSPSGDPTSELQNQPVQFVQPVYLSQNIAHQHPSATTPKAAPSMYPITRAGDAIVRYTTPGGISVGLNVDSCAQDTWCCTQGADGYEICYYNYSSSVDDTMTFTLLDATSIRCTLLHYEDDAPRKLYYATDGGNNCPPGSNQPCFMLRSAGDTSAPVRAWASYMIACF